VKAITAIAAAIPGIVALTLTTFKPEARSLWWWAKYRKLDELVSAIEGKEKSTEEAKKELKKLLDLHNERYPGLGTPPVSAA
jgi:hypothetical protein